MYTCEYQPRLTRIKRPAVHRSSSLFLSHFIRSLCLFQTFFPSLVSTIFSSLFSFFKSLLPLKLLNLHPDGGGAQVPSPKSFLSWGLSHSHCPSLSGEYILCSPFLLLRLPPTSQSMSSGLMVVGNGLCYVPTMQQKHLILLPFGN